MKHFVADAAARVHSLEANTLLSHRPQLENRTGSFINSALSSASSPSVAMSIVSVGYSNSSFGGGVGVATDATTEAPVPLSTNDGDLSSPTRANVPGIPPNSTLDQRRSGVPIYSHAGVGPSPVAPISHGHPHSHTTNSHSISTGSTLSGMPAFGVRGNRTAQAHSVVICGPAGIGKSTLIQTHQASWRRRGLWGHAKMVKGEASPFTGLVSFKLLSLP
jgi:hypothetical protein